MIGIATTVVMTVLVMCQSCLTHKIDGSNNAKTLFIAKQQLRTCRFEYSFIYLEVYIAELSTRNNREVSTSTMNSSIIQVFFSAEQRRGGRISSPSFPKEEQSLTRAGVLRT